MKRPATLVALMYIVAVTAVAAALAGCERQAAAPAAAAANKSSAGAEAALDTASSRSAVSRSQEHAPAAKDTMHISSSAEPGSGSVDGAPGGKPVGKSEAAQTAKPKVEAKDAYKEGKPTLLGLALKTPRDDVLAKLGTAKNKFVMDDETDPVTVYEYAEFSVGFNKKGTLEFVDVRSAEIDPGLHGLRLGQKLQDAVDALGKPDTNTSYVLTYKSEGTLLKLDLDPKNGTIRSIKLFASKS